MPPIAMPPDRAPHARATFALMPTFDRYHRQRLLPAIGDAGQERLRGATVLVAGCGALGCSTIDALARAGVGHLRLVDRDIVELTNLQRQTLYTEQDARDGTPKAIAAAARVAAINSEIEVDPIVADLSSVNATRISSGCDLIVDGLDNFETRYLLNDLAVRDGLPYVYGGAVGTTGMSLVILPRASGEPRAALETPFTETPPTPCLRCLFPEAPPPGATPTCDTAGVLGPMVTLIGAFQAAQAIKLLVGAVDAVDRRLLTIELWENEWRFMDVSSAGPSPECPCCGARRFEHLDARQTGGASMLCGRDAVQIVPGGDTSERVDLAALAARLAAHGVFDVRPHMLRGVLEAERGDAGAVELTVFRDGRAIVKGIRDLPRGRAIYARYVGV